VPAPDEPPFGSGAPRDDREIEAIVAAYAGVISQAVRRVAADRAAAIEDDVQQTVIVGIWRQLQRGQTITHPASYIFRAAIRETLRLVRRERAPIAAQGASVSDLPDETAPWLFGSFYRAQRRVPQASAALREAQLDLLRALRSGSFTIGTSAGSFAVPEHPAAWASLQLWGEP
jgi:DNA-directed RNA polymerase specialized sigma24 family protein